MAEAEVAIVARMRDEATPKLKQMGQQVQQTQMSADNLKMTLTATGAAMSAVGALIARMDSPMAKAASNFFIIGGAILTTTSAIMQMLPMLTQLIASLRSLAIVQAVLQAFSGPGGWIALGIGIMFLLFIYQMPLSLWLPFYGDFPEWMQQRSIQQMVIPLLPWFIGGGLVVGFGLYFVFRL